MICAYSISLLISRSHLCEYRYGLTLVELAPLFKMMACLICLRGTLVETHDLVYTVDNYYIMSDLSFFVFEVNL